MKSFTLYGVFFVLYLLIAQLGRADTRQVITVVDTGFPTSSKYNYMLCDSGHRDFTGYGIKDVLGHGTSIVDIIASEMDYTKYCIKIYKWFHTYETPNRSGYVRTTSAYLKELLLTQPSFVNLSLSGVGNFDGFEYATYRSLLKTGSTIVVSAGNDRLFLDTGCKVYPACYNLKHTRFRVVGSRRSPLFEIDGFSNFGPLVTDYERGTDHTIGDRVYQGTSQAAAVLTGKLTSGILEVKKGN